MTARACDRTFLSPYPGRRPIPLPQHVPAAAVPLPPLPGIPDAYRHACFTRVLRMFGEHGAVTLGLFREGADGFPAARRRHG